MIGPVVVVVVDEVDGRARDLHAGREHGFVDAVAVHAVSAEGGDQRGVHVDRAAVALAAQLEEREEAEQRDEIDVVARELGVERVVEGGARRECARGTAIAGMPRRSARRRPPAFSFDAITTTTSAGTSPASMRSQRFSRLVPSPESSTATRSGCRVTRRGSRGRGAWPATC